MEFLAIYQTTSSFYSKKDLKSTKKHIFSGEKMRNSDNYSYDYMLTRSSERIFNAMRYIGSYSLHRVDIFTSVTIHKHRSNLR